MDYLYQLRTLKNLDTLPTGTWYPFDSKNHIADELLDIVKLRIDLSGDFIISDDYKYFKRVERLPPKEQKKEYSGEITYKIEYLNHLVQLPFDHLPEPKFKSYSKKEWDRLSGRADK